MGGFVELAVNLKVGTYDVKITCNKMSLSNKIVIKPLIITKDLSKKKTKVIKFTAKVLTTNVLKIEGSNNFVGHIGGDDFIAILEDPNYEKIAQNIIADYDGQLEKYFEKEDYQRGYLEIENRKGEMERFPLTSISIGIVEVTPERFKNSLEIGEAGAAVKHLAKTIFGSSYVVDRRKKRDETFDKIKKKRVLV
jgi:GGDEF domain-containing protein